MSVPLPEICFGNNSLKISHAQSGFEYTFDAIEALQAVDGTGAEEGGGSVKVAHADAWAKSREGLEEVSVVRKFDWTYTTTWPGALRGPQVCFRELLVPKQYLTRCEAAGQSSLDASWHTNRQTRLSKGTYSVLRRSDALRR